MTSMRTLAILALAAPFTAAAQVSYSQATIVGERPAYYVYRDSMHVCDARNAALWDRKAALDADQRDLDRAGARIDRMKAGLDDEYRRLDWRDHGAIAAYNARSAEYNRQADIHNRYIARMNGAAATLNGDSADLVAYCNEMVVMR